MTTLFISHSSDDDTDLHYGMAAEILFLIETLEKRG